MYLLYDCFEQEDLASQKFRIYTRTSCIVTDMISNWGKCSNWKDCRFPGGSPLQRGRQPRPGRRGESPHPPPIYGPQGEAAGVSPAQRLPAGLASVADGAVGRP
jgi:hypothetical protein